MKKFLVIIGALCLSISGFGKNQDPIKQNLTNTIYDRTTYESEFTYGILKFDKLPESDFLKAKGIESLNYIDKTAIFAQIKDQNNISKLPGYISFTKISSSDKLSPKIIEYSKTNPLTKNTCFIYLAENMDQKSIDKFCFENSLESIKKKSLPKHVVMTKIGNSQLAIIQDMDYVTWVMLAPKHAVEGDNFHVCSGGQTVYGPTSEFSRFSTINEGWEGSGNNCINLTYYFHNETPDIPGTTNERNAIKNAFTTWSKYVGINFTEVFTPGLARSIDISWETSFHGDGHPFDGQNGVLAHAFFPPPNNTESIAGDLHFDEAENWSLSNDIHLYSVALHEIGHSLGLGHSTVPNSVMNAIYEDGNQFFDLHSDDIDGIRSLYRSRSVQNNEWDKTFIGDVSGNSDKEIVLVNTSYSDGAIRVDDIETGTNLLWIEHCPYQGWMDNSDKMFLADATGDGKSELILVNTGYSGGAILVIDLTTGAHIRTFHHNTSGFIGWMDSDDKMFTGDINGDGKSELILINTSLTDGAIRTVDLLTGENISIISHSGSGFIGWMDNSDRFLIGDVNNDGKKDLILINTSYDGGAIRTVDLMSGTNIGLINHSGTNFNNWMDPSDKVVLADINNDGKDEVILINTSLVAGAIRAIDPLTGNNYSLISHVTGGYIGWMDSCDRMFIADVNNDNNDDLVLVNTEYNFAAIRAVNISNGSTIKWVDHAPYGFLGWMDATDRMFCNDVNSDGEAELILINTDYTFGAIRAFTINTRTNLSVLPHNNSYLGWMDGSSEDQNCMTSPIFKSSYFETPTIEEENTKVVIPLKDNLQEISIKVYPNPANDHVIIQISNAQSKNNTLKIYDINGKLIQNDTTLENGSNFINFPHLTKGTYILEISTEAQVFHKKIQISH